MQHESLLLLAGGSGRASDLLSSQPRLPYTPEEQQLSVFVQREIDHLIMGNKDQLILLKFYPQRADKPSADGNGSVVSQGGARREITEQIAADALNFFGPLHGGVITQESLQSDVIVQGRKFSTSFPHIILERYDCYDALTSEPLLGAWRACRIQNQRKETRTNRMIDIALLALEVSQSVFPRLIR